MGSPYARDPARIEAEWQVVRDGVGSIADALPVVGTGKGVVEAINEPTLLNVAAAVASIIPGGKHGTKLITSLRSGGRAPTQVLPPTAGTTVSSSTSPNAAPDFIVTRSGDVLPVPAGSVGPLPSINRAGKQTGSRFVGGSGGPGGLDPRVESLRLMDPTPPKGSIPGYPYGYGVYMNSRGQTVDPFTGRTLAPSHPLSHIPF